MTSSVLNPLSVLNLCQSSDDLDKVYSDQYYNYLKSAEFRRQFLSVLGWFVDYLGKSCLDVGCGEGWLSEYITVVYTGIDGSGVAIERGRQTTGSFDRRFFIDRIEDPELVGQFDVIVFGGLFSVLIDPSQYLRFLRMYLERYNPSYFIVYDLQTLDTEQFDRNYNRLWYIESTANVPGLQEVKKHRKILVYSCK